MRIMSKVCAEFHSKSGEVLFRVTPDKLYALTDAPDAISQDPLFDLLVDDHVLEVAGSKADQKRLENDPDKPVKAEKPAKSGRSAKAEKRTDSAAARTEKPAESASSGADDDSAETSMTDETGLKA